MKNRSTLTRPDGTKLWYKNGLLQRTDGPAIEYPNGVKIWYNNGKLHRIHGPAVEWNDGTKEWYLNGRLHRINGPAVEWFDRSKAWFLDGINYTKLNYYRELFKRKLISKEKLGIILLLEF